MRCDGRTFRRRKIWWIAYYRDGQEIRESSGSEDRKSAVKLLRQRVGQVSTARLSTSAHFGLMAPDVTMLQLFDLVEENYRLNRRTSSANDNCLRRLRRQFARYKVQECTGLAIYAYMRAMQRQGRKPATINREIAVLRFALRLGHQHDLVARVPIIKLLQELNVCNEFFTREELNALVPHLPDHLRDLVVFAFLTGWRKGEITGLRWANVNRSGGVIRLEQEQNKARDVRVLTLQGEVAAIIERRWRSRKVGNVLAEHVFHNEGRRQNDFRSAWHTACRLSGLGHRKFHSLRRSAARNMSLQGVPEKVIMSIMGHKTRVMFDRYNIVTEADQRAYTRRLFGP